MIKRLYMLLLCTLFLVVLSLSVSGWANDGYNHRKNLSCTNLNPDVPILLNGEHGVVINATTLYIWTVCNGTNPALYYNSSTVYAVYNDEGAVPFESEYPGTLSYRYTDLWSDYSMVYHGGPYTDSTENGLNASCSTTCASNVTAKLGDGWDCGGSATVVAPNSGVYQTGNSHIMAWMSETSNNGNNYPIAVSHSSVWSSPFLGYSFFTSGDNFQSNHNINGVLSPINAGSYLTSSTWTLYSIGWDGDKIWMHVNAGIVSNADQTDGSHTYGSNSRASFCRSPIAGGSSWNGKMDEVRFAPQTFNESYLGQIYNNSINTSGYGNLLSEEDAPAEPDLNFEVEWELHPPANNTYTENISMDFDFNFTGDSLGNQNNCSFYDDGVQIGNLTGLSEGTNYTFTQNHTVPYEANDTYYIECFGDNGGADNSSEKLIRWNLELAPYVEIYSPLNDSNIAVNPVVINFTVNQSYLQCDLLSNYTGSFEVVNQTEILETFNTTEADLSEGTYINTHYTGSYVQLNASSYNGTYASEIIDSGGLSVWNNITWSSQSGSEYASWRLDESSGTTASDSSGNNRDATTLNMDNSNWVSGIMGNALNFSSSDSEAVDTDLVDIWERDENFSISVWFKSGVSANQVLVSNFNKPGGQYKGIEIITLSSGKLRVALFGNNGNRLYEETTNTSYLDDNWHHAVMVYHGNSTADGLFVYVDGVDQPTTIGANSLAISVVNGADFFIGKRSDGSIYYDGLIDNVNFYDYELSQSEIETLYNAGAGLEELGGINFTVRSCNDALCDGESFTDIEDFPPIDLDVDNNQYFQFHVNFSTKSLGRSSRLYNVTVEHNLYSGVTGNDSLSNTLPPDDRITLQYIIECREDDNLTAENSTPITIHFNITDPLEPIANITDLNNVSFISGVSLEATDNLSISSVCYNENITFSNLNVSYSNGTLIYSGNDINVTFPGRLFNMDDNYTVALYCIDDEGQSDIDTKIFEWLDTTSPEAVWVSPLFDNSTIITEGQQLDIDVTVSDINLFSLNMSCIDNLSVIKFNQYVENITEQSFQFQSITENITNLGTGVCTLTVMDRHTHKDISKMDFKPRKVLDSKALKFNYKGSKVNISTTEDITDFRVEKRKDRYVFEPKVNRMPNKLTYYAECETGYLWDFYDEEYGYHFGCGLFWIDFNIEGVSFDRYKVTRINDYKAKVDINLPKGVKSLRTESIGIKNILIENASFEVLEEIPDNTLTDSQAWFYLVLFGVWLGLLFIGFTVPVFFLLFVDGLYGIFLAVSVMRLETVPFMSTLAFIFIGLNALLCIVAYLGWKE